jgi:hypothetical protein
MVVVGIGGFRRATTTAAATAAALSSTSANAAGSTATATTAAAAVASEVHKMQKFSHGIAQGIGGSCSSGSGG